MSHKNKVEIPDVFGDALINIMNEIHKDNELCTGFVVLMETYNGKKEKNACQDITRDDRISSLWND
jgi:hypothetical protein